QKITITASTNMTEEEINQRVKEAEQYAEQDKKRKEEVEIQNRADTLIYEMEKQLRENGDKLDSADKETVQHEIDEFKKVRESGDTEAIKNAMESMTQKVYQIFGKLYQQEGGQPGAGEGPQVNDDGTIDADAEVK
ncbi:MAG TPA: Hsp70 family protein, partial [Candidatus Limiplasma pullistercoris]|nr:Hsp70 family protein [Candidatus Limiplasma pullistercoris]